MRMNIIVTIEIGNDILRDHSWCDDHNFEDDLVDGVKKKIPGEQVT